MPGTWERRTWPADASLYAPRRYRRACHYDAFTPVPLSELRLSLSAEQVGLVSDAEQSILALNRVEGRVLAPLARLLLRTESVASSKVEGLQLGARELARAESRLESGETVGGTALDLIGNIDAMELAVGVSADAPRFGIDEIMAIHARLMERAPNRSSAGRIRTVQNWIGGNDYTPCGADFVPPPPESVPKLLDDLCSAVNDDVLSPFVQAALVHAQFETIHPFEDGNGRTGRALVHVILRRRALAPHYIPPISVVLAAARTRYIEGLTAFRGEGVELWVEQFAAASARAARLAASYVAAVRALQVSWREQLAASAGALRSDAVAWAIIDLLPERPVITAQTATAATGRVKTAVYGGIEQLVAAGVLAPLGASRRNRAWEAVGLLALVEGLEAGDSPA